MNLKLDMAKIASDLLLYGECVYEVKWNKKKKDVDVKRVSPKNKSFKKGVIHDHE